MTVLRAAGGSLEEVAFAQGRATAEQSRERLLEDLAHVRSATGTPWDAFATRSFLPRTARRAHARLADGSRGLVDAYAAGVRAGGVEDWDDWTSPGVMAVHHALFGSLGHHLWRRHVGRTLGPAALDRLVQEAPALSGSNAWVVGGSRSADGLPLVGADPHRLVSVPGVYTGFADKIPIGALMEKGLTLRTGQTHVHKYLPTLLEHIEHGRLDPSVIISHRLPIDAAPEAYAMFNSKRDECIKVVLQPN